MLWRLLGSGGEGKCRFETTRQLNARLQAEVAVATIACSAGSIDRPNDGAAARGGDFDRHFCLSNTAA
jgi:hypothetical protein